MKNLLLFLTLSLSYCAPAYAQSFPPTSVQATCMKPNAKDWWKIEDDGPHRAIVTYYNSKEQCSRFIDEVITSDNGIEVRVIINVGDDGQTGETITVIPMSEQYMAFPADRYVEDGETTTIIVQGGTS